MFQYRRNNEEKDAKRSTVEGLVSGHPRDVKKVSVTGAGRLREINVKIQSLYVSCGKRSFVKAAVSRAVRLPECPLGSTVL